MLDFRGLWVEFRGEMGRYGLIEGNTEKRRREKEGGKETPTEMVVRRWDEFFEMELTGEAADANAEGSASRTGAGDLNYWSRELKEGWDMELSERWPAS